MEKNIKKWIMDYGVIARRRFFKKEKIRFIRHIEHEFREMGYSTSILAPRNSKGKAIDLLIGDVKKANTIVIANFDTPAKSFGVYNYRPFDLRKRNFYYLTITAFVLIFLVTIGFIFSTFFLKIEWLNGIFHWSDIWALILYTIIIHFIVRYARGIPNGKNLNRSSSQVIALLMIAQKLKKETPSSTAFVLTDFGCINHLGEQMLKAYLEKYDKKKFILLDCLGGNDLAVCYTPSFESKVKLLNKNVHRFICDEENNIAKLYPNTLVMSSGDLVNNILLCRNVNTRKDIDINTETLSTAVKEILKLI